MKTTHLTDRKPGPQCQSKSWGRLYNIKSGFGLYRIFRRSSVTRKWFGETVEFSRNTDRRAIANDLRRLRVKLRDRVDAYDLELMGVTQ